MEIFREKEKGNFQESDTQGIELSVWACWMTGERKMAALLLLKAKKKEIGSRRIVLTTG